MTEVLHSPSSSSSPSSPATNRNPTLFHQGVFGLTGGEIEEEEEEEEEEGNRVREKRDNDSSDQLSLLAILFTLFRKSFWATCKTERGDFSGGEVMEISWPTEVQHVNHVTFDRFDGFLGLPVEFEPEVPRRAPSARYIQTHIHTHIYICNRLYECCYTCASLTDTNLDVLFAVLDIGFQFLHL